jgi:hypothetical protein
VQEGGELEVAPVARAEAEGIAHGQGERHDPVAVLAAGVGIVGLEQVAHQQRGAAVGVRQRERLVDVCAPLAREEGEQPHDGKHEGDGERLALAGHAGEDADRGEGCVDGEDPREETQLHLRRGAESEPDPQPGEAGVAHGLRTEGDGEDRPVVEADVGGPEQGHDQRRPDRVEGVGQDERHARDVHLAAHVGGQAPDEQAGGDE